MAFGIDALRKFIERAVEQMQATLACQSRALQRLESAVAHMATRADFDNLKAELKQDIQAVVQTVTDLRNQLANGNPITDQDLQDLQDDINPLTGNAPSPTPGPAPAPSP